MNLKSLMEKLSPEVVGLDLTSPIHFSLEKMLKIFNEVEKHELKTSRAGMHMTVKNCH